MSNGNSNSNSGIGFFGMLAILFIGLKLGRVISWPWWQVLLPIWGSVALGLVIAILAVLGIASKSRKAQRQMRARIAARDARWKARGY